MKKRRGPSVAEVVTAALERMERARQRRDLETFAILHAVAEQLTALANPVSVVQHREGPVPFVQMFTMQRGYYHALMALDSAGALWERHQTVDKANKIVTEEWWEEIKVERR